MLKNLKAKFLNWLRDTICVHEVGEPSEVIGSIAVLDKNGKIPVSELPNAIGDNDYWVEEGSGSSEDNHEVAVPVESIQPYSVSPYALNIIKQKIRTIVEGKESIQAMGEPKYLLSKDDINSIAEHVTMSVYEDVEEFMSHYVGRELR